MKELNIDRLLKLPHIRDISLSKDILVCLYQSQTPDLPFYLPTPFIFTGNKIGELKKTKQNKKKQLFEDIFGALAPMIFLVKDIL